MNKNLFGQSREQTPQKFPISSIDRPDHRKCTPEEKSILTSALIKHMRLGAIERSIETYWKMRITGVPQEYIVKRLCAFCWEDATGSEILAYAAALQTTWQHDADNAIMRTIIACCKAPKFFHSREEADLEVLRIRVRESVKEQARKSLLVIDDFPAWCHDLYCIQGRVLGAGNKAHPNNRYCGILQGGLNLRAETIAYDQPSPDKPSLYDSEAVRESARQRISVDEWIERQGMTVEEWKNSTQKTNS